MHFVRIIYYFCDLSNRDELMMKDLSILVLSTGVFRIMQHLNIVSLTTIRIWLHYLRMERAVVVVTVLFLVFFLFLKKKRSNEANWMNYYMGIIKDMYSTIIVNFIVYFFYDWQEKRNCKFLNFDYYKFWCDDRYNLNK